MCFDTWDYDTPMVLPILTVRQMKDCAAGRLMRDYDDCVITKRLTFILYLLIGSSPWSRSDVHVVAYTAIASYCQTVCGGYLYVEHHGRAATAAAADWLTTQQAASQAFFLRRFWMAGADSGSKMGHTVRL